MERPALTRRRRERRLVAQGSCRPICPSFLRAGRLIDASPLQMSDGVFASTLGLIVFPFPPSSDIKSLSSCLGSCAIPTQITSFSFTVHARCLGEWGQECGLNPAYPAGVAAHLVQGAGCQVLGVWGNAVSRFAGSLVNCKNKKPQAYFRPSFLPWLHATREEWATAGRWEERGAG